MMYPETLHKVPTKLEGRFHC